ncbi:MAG: PQQ-like beta-propeller repeat protein [Acidiferrobacterales bacterium]|nr:PQQ-like beta-propeller repeat protein [Acidiferrobacterales bacterium]
MKEIRQIQSPGIFFDSTNDFYILRNESDLELYDLKKLSFIYTFSFDSLTPYQFISDENNLYVLLSIDDFNYSRFGAVNLSSFECRTFDIAEKNSFLKKGVKSDEIFGVSQGGLYSSKLDPDRGAEFKLLSDLALKFSKVVFHDEVFVGFVRSKNLLCAVSSVGKNLWMQPLSEYEFAGTCRLASSLWGFRKNIYAVTYDKELICLSLNDGRKRWSFQGCSSTATKLYNGRIYTFYKGKLLILDAETGDLITSISIDFGLSDDEQDDLTLFQLLVTDTHAWCAFLGGRGLQAINLETFQVDWSGFEGRTINVPPKLRNNYMFLNFMDGGIGIGENSGSSNYILEGVGGYDTSAGTDQFYLD